VENVINTVDGLVFLNNFILGLTGETGQQVHSHAQFLVGSQSAEINQNLQIVALEEPHEILNEHS